MAQKVCCPNGHCYESDPAKVADLVQDGVLIIDAKCPTCGLPFALVPA